MMEVETPSLDARIAQQVRTRRAAAGLTLDALAGRCGVSRSMLSLVERGESSPTAAVLDKIATGLGVPLAALFDTPQPPAEPVSRLADQAQWRDPASGYVRRNVSPPGAGSPFRIVEVEFPPGAQVAYDTGPRAARIEQQVWVLDGTIDVTTGAATHRLHTGDCLAMSLDRPSGFHNPMRQPARYAVVISQSAAEPAR